MNPLPHGLRCLQGMHRTCGSGFTRERASTGETQMKTPPEQVAFLLYGSTINSRPCRTAAPRAATGTQSSRPCAAPGR
ncbi:hypothetical protein CMV24_06445 [Pseudomonas plecoglossicida]|uniref:Uncharacterized protein n=1 Tax=Pseudomonas plecoglossicida TaxID=70775 RepID=A0A2A3M8C6_PSEDL|nr:hypothetical protein CMV24_06445 [Pseudomonas plecoglossicida]